MLVHHLQWLCLPTNDLVVSLDLLDAVGCGPPFFSVKQSRVTHELEEVWPIYSTLCCCSLMFAQDHAYDAGDPGEVARKAYVDNHYIDCCVRIQAWVRGFTCRRKYETLRKEYSERNGSSPEGLSGASNEMKVFDGHKSPNDGVDEDLQLVDWLDERMCGNWQLFEEVLNRLTHVADCGSVDDFTSCLELARSIGLEEEAAGLEERFNQRKEEMENWLAQVINGWDTRRLNLQNRFEEASRLEMAAIYAGAEAILCAREREISEGLEMAILKGSRCDFYHWMGKAKQLGMDEVISKCYKGFQRKLKSVADSVEREAKLGVKEDYSVLFHDATSLGLHSQSKLALRIILKRVLLLVRRAIILAGSENSEHNPSAQDWKTVETEGEQLGLELENLRTLKQAVCEGRNSESVKKVWRNSFTTNDVGAPFGKMDGRTSFLVGGDEPASSPTDNDVLELSVMLNDPCRPPDLQVINALSSSPLSPGYDGLRHVRAKVLPMPRNWSEMRRLQSHWQQNMIALKTEGLVDLKLYSQGDKNFSSDSNSITSSKGSFAKTRESATSPFMTADFLESFNLEQIGERMKSAPDSDTGSTEEQESESSGLPDSDEDVKQDTNDIHVQIFTPIRSCVSKEFLERKLNCGRRELRWVVRLELVDENLTSLGKKEIFHWCPRLRSLTVDANKLRTFKEALEGGEEYLEYLSARDNSLQDLVGLEGLQKLTVLHLDGNLLTQLAAGGTISVSPAISKDSQRQNIVPKLTSTSNDHAHDIYTRCLKVGWSRLQILTLSGNRLTSVPQLGSLCPNLEMLDLGSNQIVTLGKGKRNALAGLQHLRVLYVGQNRLKGRSLWEGLQHCPELVSLVASRNQLTELPNHWGSVLLREIWLNGNAIKQLGCSVWLPSLQRLYLQDNLISTLLPLWGCPVLEVLDLSFNCIAEHSQLQHLASFPNLRSLQLNDNPISEQANHVDHVLRAVPWLSELDNEAISKESREKVISTIVVNIMKVVGLEFVKDKVSRGEMILRRFANPCRVSKIIPTGQSEHTENLNAEVLTKNCWEVNDVMNGEADETSLWAILLEVKQLVCSSSVLRRLLMMNGDSLICKSLCTFSETELEAKSSMTAYQRMAHSLRGKLHAATRERGLGRVVKDMDFSNQLGHQRSVQSDINNNVLSSRAALSSGKGPSCNLEWCLEEHVTFDPKAHMEVYTENAEYKLQVEAQIRKVIKVQALSRTYLAKIRVEILRQQKITLAENEKEKSVCKVQALWKGRKVRKAKVLECLRQDFLERNMQNCAAIAIQARWKAYNTRLKFQKALQRARYNDYDEFDYVPVDENEFLAGERALESAYQPIDLYIHTLSACQRGHSSRLDEKENTFVIPYTTREPERSTPPMIQLNQQDSTAIAESKYIQTVTIPAHFDNEICEPSVTVTNELPVRGQEGLESSDEVLSERLDCQAETSLNELLESMGFSLDLISGGQRISPREGGVSEEAFLRNISGRLDGLLNTSTVSEDLFETKESSERSTLPAVDSKRRVAIVERKAAVEEIAKDWGFKNERTAHAYLKARDRTTKTAKELAHQYSLRDPTTRLKRFKARMGRSSPAANAEESTFRKNLSEQIHDSGLCEPKLCRPSGHVANVQERILPCATETSVDTKMKDAGAKLEARQDARKRTMKSGQEELSPWHIPTLDLNSSLQVRLIHDRQESGRK